MAVSKQTNKDNPATVIIVLTQHHERALQLNNLIYATGTKRQFLTCSLISISCASVKPSPCI